MLDALCVLFVQVTIMNVTHTQTHTYISVTSLYSIWGHRPGLNYLSFFINRVGGFAASIFLERKRLETYRRKNLPHSFQALAFTSIQVITSFFCICTGEPHWNQNLRSAIFSYPPKPLLQLLPLILYLWQGSITMQDPKILLSEESHPPAI